VRKALDWVAFGLGMGVGLTFLAWGAALGVGDRVFNWAAGKVAIRPRG